MNRVRARLAAVVLGATGLSLLVHPAADAAGATAVGWWNRADNGNAVPTTVPGIGVPELEQSPTLVAVPEDGLYVADDPSGPAAMSVVQVADAPDGAARLVLHVAPNAIAPPDVPILACPVTSEWTPVADGPWDERPSFDCEDAAVTGWWNNDATAVTWDLDDVAPFRVDDGLEFALVPKEDDPSPFAVAFEPVDDEAFTAYGVRRTTTTTGSTSTTTTTVPEEPDDEGDILGPVLRPPTGGGVRLSPSSTTTSLARGDAELVASGPDGRKRLIGTDGALRAVVSALLLLAAVAMWWQSGRPRAALASGDAR